MRSSVTQMTLTSPIADPSDRSISPPVSMIICAIAAKTIGTMPRNVRSSPTESRTDGSTDAMTPSSAAANTAAGRSRRRTNRNASMRPPPVPRVGLPSAGDAVLRRVPSDMMTGPAPAWSGGARPASPLRKTDGGLARETMTPSRVLSVERNTRSAMRYAH